MPLNFFGTRFTKQSGRVPVPSPVPLKDLTRNADGNPVLIEILTDVEILVKYKFKLNKNLNLNLYRKILGIHIQSKSQFDFVP